MTIIDKIAPIKITPVVPVIKQRNNNNLCSSGFKVHVVSSDKVENFHKSLEEIIEQLKELSENEIPIKLSLFSECKTKLDYSVKCKQVQAILDSNKFIIQFSLIAQRPANNNALVAEITTINFVANKSEIIKNQENYTIINHKGLEVLIACIQPTIEKNFEDSVMTSFNVLDNILIESGFRYRDIVRQWNYIEDILQIKNNDTGIRQNYQLFNDIRAIHYSSDKFHHGYPAATGIGTASGTCNIEILAIKNENIKIKAILNNRQKNFT